MSLVPETPTSLPIPAGAARGIKFDAGKLRFDLLPPQALAQVVEILNYGATKYADRNWEKGIPWGKVFGAIMRHLWAWWGGEDEDPESGLSHVAHAACNCLFLLTYERTYPEGDDRSKSLPSPG